MNLNPGDFTDGSLKMDIGCDIIRAVNYKLSMSLQFSNRVYIDIKWQRR